MNKDSDITKNTLAAWKMIIPIMFAAFMFALDETIANIALPHIAGSFSVSNSESMWVLTSYLIASCLTIPMIDWLTALMGRRNMFMLCVTLFTISSFLCGISSSMTMMIIARFFQGLGGGILIPIAQSFMLESFDGEDLAKASTLFGLVCIMAPILGPVLGGWITENMSWRWIFYINIPVGIFILITTIKFFFEPTFAKKQKNVKTDIWGIIFLFMFAVAFQTMMDKGNDKDWFGSVFIIKLTIIWVIGLIGFIIAEWKCKHPLLKFDILKNWNYFIGTIAITIFNGILLGSMAMLPQFMQTMMGYDAYTSGVSMMPRGIGCLIGCIINSKIQTRVDLRIISASGILFLCLGSWMLGYINLEISAMSIALPNILYGFGMSLGLIPLVTLSCQTVRPEAMANASSLQNFIKTIGGAIGTSLVATFISRFSQVHQNMLTHTLTDTNGIFAEKMQAYISQFTLSTDISTATHMAHTLIYNQLSQQAHLWAYIDSFRIFAITGLVILLLVCLAKSNRTYKSE